ncbi:neuroligin-4, X-linked-like [Mytilus galloprovincialis]|uniref:neuroligin-4, X-linked-like n=1 Tax=Mytilus galloprovincialis TaxID=29158 RepID=UPI003F7C0BEF
MTILDTLIVTVLCCISVTSTNEWNPIRNTLYGKIRGKVTSRLSGKHVEEYLGIPYASPPIGSLRFERPVPPLIWSDIKDTISLPPACPQYGSDYIDLYREGFNAFDEDCLYMNVYVPKTKQKSLAVLLYVHGGSNIAGMGAMLDGDVLAAHGEIIVITFNYRLGIYGFYADKSKGIEGIYGLLDQVQAMEWVNQNIKYFNGDPERVTIHGHSLGASDVGLHIVSNLTKGLFKNAIIHSGSPIAHWFLSDCVRTSRKTSFPVNCRPGTTRVNNKFSPIHDKRMNLSEEMLNVGLTEDITFGTYPITIDGYYTTESPELVYRCGNNIHAESVLLVLSRDELFPSLSTEGKIDHITIEGLINYYQTLFPDEDQFASDANLVFNEWKESKVLPFPQASRIQADLIFYTPMIKLADIVSRWLNKTYLLSFEYISETPSGPLWQGVPHGWDLFYMFGMPLVGHHLHNYTARDVEVTKTSMSLLSDYVKYGYLSTNDTELTEVYDSNIRNYYKIDYNGTQAVVTTGVNFRKPYYEFWNKYLYKYEDTMCDTSTKLSVCSYNLWFPVTIYTLFYMI